MGKQMSTVYRLIRRSFDGQEQQFGEDFASQDEAALYYQERIKINPRFDTFFVVDKIVDEKFAVRALIFGLLKTLEK
jgi:hypothetical protein